MSAVAPRTGSIDELPGVCRFRENAVEYMNDVGDVQACGDLSRFVDLVVDLVRELDENGDVVVTSGIGRPQGCLAEYPDFWVNLKLEQSSARRSLGGLNDELVEIDRLEHHTIDVANPGEGEYTRSFTDLRLVPSLDTGGDQA